MCDGVGGGGGECECIVSIIYRVFYLFPLVSEAQSEYTYLQEYVITISGGEWQ